jgi:two-component system LytT family sensor kinase
LSHFSYLRLRLQYHCTQIHTMNKITKIEGWVATGIFLLVLFPIVIEGLVNDVFTLQRWHGGYFAEHHQVYDYYINSLLPKLAKVGILYAAFIFVNTFIVPRFIEQKRYAEGILLGVVTAGIVFLVILVAKSYQDAWLYGVYDTIRGAHMHMAKSAFITTIFCGILYISYYLLKLLYLQQIHQRLTFSARTVHILKEAGLVISLWCMLMVVAASQDMRGLMNVLLWLTPFYVIVYFGWHFWILPAYDKHQSRTRLYQQIIALSLIVGGGTLILFNVGRHLSRDKLFIVMTMVTMGELLIVLPLGWWRHYKTKSRSAMVRHLRAELGQSTANLDFLRSQINPHFLFNALNTLYGTSLQENAPRTSEGIQQLGDIMRFMLHENNREKIPLSKEVAYLHNYISLQRLRIQSSPDIQIDIDIVAYDGGLEIAPMLLIPFIENAFKYGISLRNKSRIAVSFYCEAEKIYFDVSNTIHAKPEHDTEPERTGIGLENVKQRLSLLYPDRHELTIRQSASEFFVHLTIDTK